VSPYQVQMSPFATGKLKNLGEVIVFIEIITEAA
jgi:hypothetical protein